METIPEDTVFWDVTLGRYECGNQRIENTTILHNSY